MFLEAIDKSEELIGPSPEEELISETFDLFIVLTLLGQSTQHGLF